MKVLSLDIEATGLNRVRKDEILQVGICCQGESGPCVVLDKYYGTVDVSDWEEAQRICGISPSDVSGLAPFSDPENISEAAEILGGCGVLVGWNMAWDIAMLEQSGLDVMDMGITFVDVEYDYAAYAYALSSDRRSVRHKLVDAANSLGFYYSAHNAVTDASAALFVYEKLIEHGRPVIGWDYHDMMDLPRMDMSRIFQKHYAPRYGSF